MKGQLDLRQFAQQSPSSASIADQVKRSPHSDVEFGKQQRIKNVLDGIDRLPTLPNVVHEVVRLTNDPNTRAADFVPFFSKEQTLTARMLRIANSAFYGMNGKIKTISKAVVILGHKTLKSIVLASSATVLFRRASPEYGFAENGLWLHSVTVAHLARHLATHWMGFSAETADEIFVVGLLHDIGKVLLCQELVKYPEEFNAYMESHGATQNVTAMEQAIVGIDHCKVGEVIIRKWKIGNDIASAIAHHHDTFAHPGENARYHATLALADWLCNEAGTGLGEKHKWVGSVPDKILEIAGIDGCRLDQIREEAQAVFAESIELFNAMT
ncbi:MAG: HDOD domain-containing protein [Gammaproteobacteria bacterium]